MKNIKNIEEAKKYLGKIVYSSREIRNTGKHKVHPLYIGGVRLFYNQVDYEVTSFETYENPRFTVNYGSIELDQIGEKFEETNRWNKYYFFSESEAEKYCQWSEKDELEKEERRDIEEAKRLLDAHKITYEIFS